MIIDVTEVTILEDYNLLLHFNDGNSGEVNIKELVPFEGIFKPLQDYKYFSKVYVNHDIGTICWENGADIAPDFLYQKAIH
jgi:hypothetical protein